MKAILATAALTAMFLSAGASANNDSLATPVAKSSIVNVTVISKNNQWPMQVEACRQRRCLDA
jgi:hypothetical protein